MAKYKHCSVSHCPPALLRLRFHQNSFRGLRLIISDFLRVFCTHACNDPLVRFVWHASIFEVSSSQRCDGIAAVHAIAFDESTANYLLRTSRLLFRGGRVLALLPLQLEIAISRMWLATTMLYYLS